MSVAIVAVTTEHRQAIGGEASDEHAHVADRRTVDGFQQSTRKGCAGDVCADGEAHQIDGPIANVGWIATKPSDRELVDLGA